MKNLSSNAKAVTLIAILSLVFVLFVYGEVQHVLRTSANDPQIQIAEDVAALILQGNSPARIIGSVSVEISRSIDPFVIIFDEAGNPVASSGRLHGQVPAVPKGVLLAAKTTGENRLTWQPEPGVRIASVVTAYSATTSSAAISGFVLAGRSMREQERRDADALHMAIAAWVAIVAAAAVGLKVLYPKS